MDQRGLSGLLLQDQVAIVTGGASGIGAEVCRRFAQEGAIIVILDVNQQTAAEVAAQISATGGRAVELRTDITDYSEVEATVAETMRRWQTVDIVVTCAGVNVFAAPDEISQELWQRLLDVNLTGTWNVCRAVIPRLMEQRAGKIVTISSVAGISATPKAAAYTAAKHGVIGLTRALAVDLAPYSVNVNCICPTSIETPLLMRTTSQAFHDARVRRIPLGRLGKPSDVANAALFLASPASDFITGIVLPVDGGITCCIDAHHYQ